MIPFLDLKGLNAQYRAELIEACTKVIDNGWFIHGNECKEGFGGRAVVHDFYELEIK